MEEKRKILTGLLKNNGGGIEVRMLGRDKDTKFLKDLRAARGHFEFTRSIDRSVCITYLEHNAHYLSITLENNFLYECTNPNARRNCTEKCAIL